MQRNDKLELKRPVFSSLLAWLVPGLGHWYQGRFGKAILYFTCVMGIFLFGLQQGGWKNVYFRWDKEEWRWAYICQVGAGAVALPALIHWPPCRGLLPAAWHDFELPPRESEMDELHRTRAKRMDIALIYTMVAGLLNFLAVYDVLEGPALYEEELRRRAMRSSADESEMEPTA